MAIRVYTARGMTGRVKEDVVKEALVDKEYLEKAGFEVLDPVTSEGVQPTKERLISSKKAMDSFWPRDKQMIREAHLIFDMTPQLNSEGCKHEIGYGRYSLWKPVVRIFPKGQLPFKSSIAFYEDDCVVDSLEEAIEYSLRVHGTFLKRLKWRLKLLNRCLPRWVMFQIKEFK